MFWLKVVPENSCIFLSMPFAFIPCEMEAFLLGTLMSLMSMLMSFSAISTVLGLKNVHICTMAIKAGRYRI